jgi:2'-5' RNA ligase
VTTQETAVLIPVPEAEDVVREIRTALDPAAARGIPAHVTLLYPFVPPDRLTDDVLERVAEVIGGVPPFEAELTEPGWFGDSVLWLRPEPADRFAEITSALWRAFPEHPPYAGAFTSSVPHLTVGQDVSRELMQSAATDVVPRLPIPFAVEHAVLMTGDPDDDVWQVRAEFPLGARRSAARRGASR